MEEFEIKILEHISDGSVDRDDMLRRLLVLYGIRERYFYHYSYRTSFDNYKSFTVTDELIECSEDIYDRMMSNEEDINWHKPVKYLSNEIPYNKKLRNILYIR